jgi:small subunit ribosomal protein S3
MGLIGIRIRIAQKDKVVPEFEMKDDSVKDKPIKTEEKPKIVVSTETEQIKLDEEKIKKIESLEEEEEELK